MRAGYFRIEVARAQVAWVNSIALSFHDISPSAKSNAAKTAGVSSRPKSGLLAFALSHGSKSTLCSSPALSGKPALYYSARSDGLNCGPS